MHLIIPVQDGHEWTRRVVEQLALSSAEARGPADVHVTIFDNGSTDAYSAEEFPIDVRNSLSLRVVALPSNVGFYRPLGVIAHDFAGRYDELVGVMHNDVFIYEHGWNVRMWQAFEDDLQLGLVGLCGSSEADSAGGRGSGTMCHFRGEQGQSQAAGMRIGDLRPSVFLDSLFMMFRTAAITALDEHWPNLPLAHFYDKIWPLQLWKRGWRVGTMGIECDHAGGVTIMANERYAADCKQWFDERPHEALHIDTRAHINGRIDYELAMYLMAEQRLLKPWRDESKFIPCWVDSAWKLHKGVP